VSPTACQRCRARSWLLARLAGHLDVGRVRLLELLELGDHELIAAVGGRHQPALRRELAEARRPAAPLTPGPESICRCQAGYPSRLGDLGAPPSVLHAAGGLKALLAAAEQDPVAVVGSRRPSAYGIEVARGLGRELASAGVPVVSGLALGIDSAAHAGALEAGGSTIAVLPGPADRPYPRHHRRLYAQILKAGAAVSELPSLPGLTMRRWMFPARNRVIAGLSAMTVVVEAAQGSGALLTAAVAANLGRPVGAVPGRVTSRQAAGPNRLLAEGARVIRGAQDVLDAVFGAGERTLAQAGRSPLAPDQARLLEALTDGAAPAQALVQAGLDAETGMAALASLELEGYVRRQPAGRYEVIP
jgi:DNA processing protein